MSTPPPSPPAEPAAAGTPFGPANTPLFPLGTVLFPGGLLPLRIFEVRYLDMIGRCHKAGQPFGVVALSEGSEVQRPADAEAGGPARPAGGGGGRDGYAREAFLPVGTLAVIDELERPQPGLMMIRCTGTQRFRVRHGQKLPHGLWVADIEPIEPDASVPVPDDLAPIRDALRQLLANIDSSLRDPSQSPVRRPHHFDDCGWVANRWCEMLPLPTAAKHRCMTLDNPLLRLELVADSLDQLGFKLP